MGQAWAGEPGKLLKDLRGQNLDNPRAWEAGKGGGLINLCTPQEEKLLDC